MKLEQQVVSLELAQKLKELEVKQDSFFFYAHRRGSNEMELLYPYAHLGLQIVGPVFDKVSAFTCSELVEMLPKNIQGRLGMMFLEIYPNAVQNTWYCGYQRVDDAIREEADSEANARAKMLIYLLENKLIAPHTEE